jgi:hypothetical protein
MALPETASFAEFATLAGVKKSYVTALRQADRLVLTADGKRVRVAESFARIQETEDPARAGVRARHAASRASTTPCPAPAPGAPPAPAEGNGEGDEAGDEERGDSFQHWRKRNERAKALAAERDNRVRDRELLEADEVTATVTGAVTVLRNRLEALADVLGPQLAAVDDEARCRGLVAEAVEHALEETARQFATMAKEDRS